MSLSQYKILLLEDDHFYCMFLRRFLEEHNYSVIETWSLEEFRKEVKDEQPDALILDVGVPKNARPDSEYLATGGLEAIDWLSRHSECRRPTTIIVIGAVLPPKTREAFEARNVTAILEKPFDPSKLTRVLQKAAHAAG